MQKPLQFKISSALKSIIGSDLINDDFIAVFELVKNAYDAHASKVDIIFENIYSGNGKIIIKDNGKGMDYDDLMKKWLFVGYSAKKDGTEEDNYDYRDKIKVKRAYAGVKGIGRFSCDRLGSHLCLETAKKKPHAKTEVLMINWDNFESDPKKEFIHIDVLHETSKKKSDDLSHGTVLKISGLKSEWDRKKFLKLKDALAKLINPITQTKDDVFEIELSIPDEIKNDKKKSEYFEILNGKIQNLIFETLDIKTTKIQSIVTDQANGMIKTSLFEGGKLVYQITEKNEYEYLHNVECVLYFLNKSAKITFTKRMNIQPVGYGHVFVYKYGLRIYPYGERGEDPFKMDNRKAQGYSRYIGTREILGFISINEPNDNLNETSSRGDGFIKTKDYLQLVEWFYENLRRLEKYVIDIVDWGNFLSEDDYINFNKSFKKKKEGKDVYVDVNKNILNLIETLSNSKSFETVEFAPNILQILNQKSAKSAQASLKNISETIENKKFDKKGVLEKIKEASKQLERLKTSKDQAEDELSKKRIENEKLSLDLEKEIKKGAFQGSLIGSDKERIISMQHQVYHSSSRIHRNIKLLLKQLGIENLDANIQQYIKVISLEATNINSIARFITKANFNLRASEIKTDIVDFIDDYLNQIYIIKDSVISTKLNIKVERNKAEFITSIRPLEITSIFDNLISNSEKAKAKNITISFKKKKDQLEISIQDDGIGIKSEDLSKVFELGYTTTNGSGIGLFQVHDIIVKKMKGDIEIKSKFGRGTQLIIRIL